MYIKSVCGQSLEENVGPMGGREKYIKRVCGHSLEENVGPMGGREMYIKSVCGQSLEENILILTPVQRVPQALLRE
jgi:hypothetical protein